MKLALISLVSKIKKGEEKIELAIAKTAKFYNIEEKELANLYADLLLGKKEKEIEDDLIIANATKNAINGLINGPQTVTSTRERLMAITNTYLGR
jgi:hypothetical protein